MGVRGLQYFMEHCCPGACVDVSLREMARQHFAKSQQVPMLVVDGMGCLRHWYSCQDWVCGGQWREYCDVLKHWVEAFTSAGIRLVFFFDGVVEEKKTKQWVKRRCRNRNEISKMFRQLKAHRQQPGRGMFCLPSAISIFTCFALRALGQEVFSTVREADYEIANYAYQNNSMAILGQDSDFVIYNSAPYLSVDKLQIDSLTTVLYDRQRLCQNVGLTVNQLPLLACLLGNDVVEEGTMQHIRNNAMATYSRIDSGASNSGAHQEQKVLALAHLVSSLQRKEEEEDELVPHSLNVSDSQRELLRSGVSWYLLPGQKAFQQGDISAVPSVPAFEKCVSPEIIKACTEKHIAAESTMVYHVLCQGIFKCSNTVEDEEDTELIAQAHVYRPCRQRIYGLLLLHGHDGSSVDLPVIREWFVYPGNSMKEPDLVHPVQISFTGDQPSLDLLWFGSGPEVPALRMMCFLSIFDCQEFSELYGSIEDCLLAALCLVTYITLQVQTLSQEDVDAYLSQAVCLRFKSLQDLKQIKLPVVCSRAVQLGSLYVRGLSNLLGANCASGCPLPSPALMPWQSFDGRLFHSKYLLAHSAVEKTVLLENNSGLSLFLCLREKLTDACKTRGRVLQSKPNLPEPRHNMAPGPRYRERHTGHPSDCENWRDRGQRHRGGWRGRGEMAGGPQHGGGWRGRGEMTGGPQHGGGWRGRGEMAGGPQHGGGWRGRGEMTGGPQHGGGWRGRGEMTGGPQYGGGWRGRGEMAGGPQHGGGWGGRGEMTGGPQHGGGWRERGEVRGEKSGHGNRGGLWETEGQHYYQQQSRGESYSSRGEYSLAPRWSQPPGPGT